MRRTRTHFWSHHVSRLALILAAFVPDPGSGQSLTWGRALTLGTEHEERYRIAQLHGGTSTEGFLLRSPSSLMARLWGGEEALFGVQGLLPELRTTWNSDLPFSFNDGALWAGRGVNYQLTVGVRVGLRIGPIRVTAVLAPHFLYQENQPFPVIPYQSTADPPRDLYANPFHPLPESIDAPLRFGDQPLRARTWGQSSVWLEVGPLAMGAGTENEWWGPGVRNALIISGHGPGFPHLTLSSSRALATRLGSVEGRWLVGRLDESGYFDEDSENNFRSLSALGLTLQPAFDPNLTLGVARVVFSTLPPGDRWPRAVFDVLRVVGQPNSGPPGEEQAKGRDQITSLFWRWIAPGAGFEAYGEWARFEEPRSLRDFLEFPQHSVGYTVGVQWAGERAEGARLGVQGEITNLEPSATWRQRPVFGTYTSRVVPQGYTHQGQFIGAAIGPASSSQWLAVDRRSGRGWRIGVFGGRIRWEAAAHYTDVVPHPKRGDVSLFWGGRMGLDLAGWSLSAELSHGVRLNYLFQTFPFDFEGLAEGVDIANTSVSVTLGKALWK